MKKYLLLLALTLVGCGRKSEMDSFVDDLMGRMTLDEKIGQLNLPVTGNIVTGQARSSNVAERIRGGEVGGLLNLTGAANVAEVQRIAVEESRLGIPLLVGLDVIHGYRTTFPIPLCMACSWDMDAIEESASIAAREAGADGIAWTFSPMVDIARDPRWGRVSEGAGEDPFLGSRVAEALVRGYQGTSGMIEGNDHILACVKHFGLYGAAEAGLDYNTTDMSRIRMYNDYLPPYKAAVDAGAGSVMSSFNDIDGVPATGNKWLLSTLLRDEWGFPGFVVTDYTAISEMITHGVGDLQETSRRALDAGADMDMVSEGFLGTIRQSIEEGKLSVETVDKACRRILEAKYRLGLFQDPYKYCDTTKAGQLLYCPEHRAAARRIASESFVLLKNEGSLLPLSRKGTIAVIGPLANTAANMPGNWSVGGHIDEATTLLDGIREVAGPGVRVLYAKGSNLVHDARVEEWATVFGRSLGRDGRSASEMLSEAVRTARQADVVVAALGESSEMTGESSSRSDISIPDAQKELLQALLATGKPVALVLFNGRPLTLGWEKENVPAILDVWFGGSEAAYAIGDVLFGDVNPSGKLTMTFPKSVGQIPIYYARKNTGRALPEGHWFEKFRTNYLDVDNDPLYPFGYGLSYTTFEYGEPVLSSSTLDWDGSIEATVRVTNTGRREGKEVVQMYIRDVVGSVTRPVRELKGFRKVCLAPGESTDVTFRITRDLLAFYAPLSEAHLHDPALSSAPVASALGPFACRHTADPGSSSGLTLAAEPGTFEVFIGPDSRCRASASFELRR